MIKIIGALYDYKLINTEVKFLYAHERLETRHNLIVDTHLNMAEEEAKLATCPRLRVGCIIYDPSTKQIISVGRNGAATGMPHCDDVGCEVQDDHDVGVIHAEPNALYWAGTRSFGCWMFLTHNPCRRCANSILQGRITRVYYRHVYGDKDGIDFLAKHNVLSHQAPRPEENLDNPPQAGVQCKEIQPE